MGQTQSTPGTDPGKKYRDLANKEGDARRELSQKSQDAWALNNGAKAKEYSLAARNHQLAMERYNTLAASEIFTFHNPSYLSQAPSLLGSLFSFFSPPNPKSALAKIDLHGLRVSEALDRVRGHLALCRKHGVGRTVVITGKGLHSVDGVAKVKPQVERLLHEEGVRVVMERGNEGAFVVEVGKEAGGGGWGEWLWRGLFGER